MKCCKYCKFFHRQYDDMVGIRHCCRVNPRYDVVTGDEVLRECEYVRRNGECGPEGKCFEQKEEVKKKLNWFVRLLKEVQCAVW